MPIAINCPACSHAGKVPDHFAGQTIRCPKCRGQFRVGPADGGATVTTGSVESRPQPQQAARCPYCGEAIQQTAKKCKHCGEWLDPAMRPGAVPDSQPAKDAPFSFDAPAGAGDDHDYAGTRTCPFCKQQIPSGAIKCQHCGEFLAAPKKSDFLAGCLGLLLGPVGLWYKGHWAAGFAWLVMGIIAGFATGFIAAPIFWIGMAIHAAVATPKR